MAGARAFEIDDVEEGDLAAERSRMSRRIGTVDRDAVVLALVKANGLAGEEIDGREDEHVVATVAPTSPTSCEDVSTRARSVGEPRNTA